MSQQLRFQRWLRAEVRRAGGQRALSTKTGIDHSTISRLCSEAREPMLSTAVQLGYVKEPQS